MVESTDLPEGDQATEFFPLNAPPVRGVFLERGMGSRPVVAAGIARDEPVNMPLDDG